MAYLEDLGCLGTALVELLGGEVDFKVMDGFEVDLEDEFTLLLMNVKGLGGGRGAEGTYRFKQVQTLRHMLDFRSSVSCFGFG